MTEGQVTPGSRRAGVASAKAFTPMGEPGFSQLGLTRRGDTLEGAVKVQVVGWRPEVQGVGFPRPILWVLTQGVIV